MRVQTVTAFTRGLQVTKDVIKLGNGEELPYGVCVWSAGNSPQPLVQQLVEQLPAQVRGGRRVRWLAPLTPCCRPAARPGRCACRQKRWCLKCVLLLLLLLPPLSLLVPRPSSSRGGGPASWRWTPSSGERAALLLSVLSQNRPACLPACLGYPSIDDDSALLALLCCRPSSRRCC